MRVESGSTQFPSRGAGGSVGRCVWNREVLKGVKQTPPLQVYGGGVEQRAPETASLTTYSTFQDDASESGGSRGPPKDLPLSPVWVGLGGVAPVLHRHLHELFFCLVSKRKPHSRTRLQT